MQPRDEFPPKVRKALAERVGVRCSNPNCRQPTSGPDSEPDKSISIGVAAHIRAAAPGGPRYDSDMSADQRKSPENGIWLCENCGKLIDTDEARYSAQLIRRWKDWAEQAALMAIAAPTLGQSDPAAADRELVRFYAQCFDRPAFQDPFGAERSVHNFERAVEDTITAVNTGCLRSRDGTVLAAAKGKVYLENRDWRQTMDAVVDLLRAILARLAVAKRSDEFDCHCSRSDGTDIYCRPAPDLECWMDATRAHALGLFGRVCDQANVQAPVFPRPFPPLGYARPRPPRNDPEDH